MLVRIFVAALVLWGGYFPSAAQQPRATTQVIVPFGPGGSGDIMMRLMAQYVSEKHNHNLIIENRPGANGILGMQASLAGPSDGSSWVVASVSSLAANPSLYKKLPYDAERDFSLVGALLSNGGYMLVRPDAQYKTLAEFLTYAKAAKDPVTYGHFNASSQVPGAILGSIAKVPMLGIPYKQIANAIAELMNGQIDVIFVDSVAGDSYVAAGTLRALATTGGKRLKKVPNVPTLSETFPEFNIEGFIGIAVRSGTPDEEKRRINQLFNEVMAAPNVRSRIEDMGFTPSDMSVEQCDMLSRVQRG